MLDLDIPWALWDPPAPFIDKSRLAGLPHHGIGRICKVGREEIVGLIVALRRFLAEDPTARGENWLGLLRRVEAGLQGVAAIRATVRPGAVPLLELTIPSGAESGGALALLRRLQEGSPSIRADASRCEEGIVIINPLCLKEGEPEIIAAAIGGLLAPAGR
jgi:D-glucosaminate-6-phosphate ammonia-lyase